MHFHSYYCVTRKSRRSAGAFEIVKLLRTCCVFFIMQASLSALNHNHILPPADEQHLPFAICQAGAVSVQTDKEEHGSRIRRRHNV